MIPINSDDLLNALKYLVPNAKCSVWNTDITQYHGETIPISMFNMLVDWRNIIPCPTVDQVIALDSAAVEATIEADRKATRNANAQSNLAIMAAYKVMLQTQPNLTLDQFLDDLEAMGQIP